MPATTAVQTVGSIRLVEATGMSARGWTITATPDVLTRLRRVLPRVQATRGGAITVIDTPEVCRDLEWICDRWPFEVDNTAAAALTAGAAAHRDREEDVTAILTGDRPHLEFDMRPAREPREYQLQAADLALTSLALLLGDDLGLGKTMSALLTLRDPSKLPALVVCPTHLALQWREQLGETLPWLRAHILQGTRPYDPSRRREMHGYDPDLLICAYSRIDGWRHHLAGKVKTVIFDECQELRRRESNKYSACAQVADGALMRIGLSATPVFNYAGEIHNILGVIAPDALGSREEFGREWGDNGWSDKMRVKDPRALGQHLRQEGLLLRRTRAEVGRELPEVVRVPHTVPADQDVHDQLMGAADATALARSILEGPHHEAFRAAGQLDMQIRHATGVAKAPYVAEFVRMVLETERKVVLFGWHRDVFEIWQHHLVAFNPVLYTGTESPAQKDQAKRRFIDRTDIGDGQPHPMECRILIMSLRSGAGLDGLQGVCTVGVFGELDWSPAMHDQCEGRFHRDGQTEPCVSYFLNADLGSDPAITSILGLKRRQSDPLINPDDALFEVQSVSPEDRIRDLARQVLAKQKGNR